MENQRKKAKNDFINFNHTIGRVATSARFWVLFCFVTLIKYLGQLDFVK
jgi:hypothetical protein